MKIRINFLLIGQISYRTWHSPQSMLVTERHQEYANKKLRHKFENFYIISIFLKLNEIGYRICP